MNQVQLFIKQFVSDEQFRGLALRDPAAALSQYRLTPAEERSLARLCSRVSGVSGGAALLPRIWVQGYWA